MQSHSTYLSWFGIAACLLLSAASCALKDQDRDGRIGSDDCDDLDAEVYVGAKEVCDVKDNNCDGYIDENVIPTWYLDLDQDGHGDYKKVEPACVAPPGYVAEGDDCDDSDPTRYPGHAEICDGKDNDCDGQLEEGLLTTWYMDVDGDGFGNSDDDVLSCSQPEGYVLLNQDCDDMDLEIHPGQEEICDGKDNNCDGQVDEGLEKTWFQDADGDGYGGKANTQQACSRPSGYVTANDDCDDGDAAVHPGLLEQCDNKDNDCNGLVDDPVSAFDIDQDGTVDCADNDHDGVTEQQGDCDDQNINVFPDQLTWLPTGENPDPLSATWDIRVLLADEAQRALYRSGPSGTCNDHGVGNWDYVFADSSQPDEATMQCLLDKDGDSNLDGSGYWPETFCSEAPGKDVWMGHAGSSEFFADLMLFKVAGTRDDGGLRYALPLIGLMNGKPIDRTLRPGDIIFCPETDCSHVSVVLRVLNWDWDCYPNHIDVVDSDFDITWAGTSDYTNINGHHIISLHDITYPALTHYLVWTGNVGFACP